MQVILLQRVAKLGQMGEVVNVKDGYARNFLLPQGKALRANAGNIATFEVKKAQLEATNLETRKEAEAVGEKLDGQTFIIIRSASDSGALYGSVTTRDAPLKLDVSVRVIEPVKNLMGFASVKFNDCFVVENLKIVQGSKGLFLGMPSQPDGKGGYRDMAYPVTKEFREQLNTAVLQAYEAKLEQMAERGSVGRASISDQLKAGKAAAEQAKAERPPKEKPSRSAER